MDLGFDQLEAANNCEGIVFKKKGERIMRRPISIEAQALAEQGRAADRAAVLAAIERHAGNVRAAGRELGLTRGTMLRAAGLTVAEIRARWSVRTMYRARLAAAGGGVVGEPRKGRGASPWELYIEAEVARLLVDAAEPLSYAAAGALLGLSRQRIGQIAQRIRGARAAFASTETPTKSGVSENRPRSRRKS